MIGVYGTGDYSVAIANIISKKNSVLIYSHREDLSKQINTYGFSSNAKVDSSIKATSDISFFMNNCSFLFLIVPSIFLKESLINIKPFLEKKHKIIHGIKGFFVNWKDDFFLEKEDIKTISQCIKEELKIKDIAYIAGPNIAKEMHQNKFSSISICCCDSLFSSQIEKILEDENLTLEIYPKVLEAEFSSILKNIGAIACGYFNSFGLNTISTIFKKFIDEMSQIFDFYLLDKNVLYTYAGIGDLVCTCFSSDSRNFSLGKRLKNGESLNEIFQEKKTYEGLFSIKAIKFISNRYNFKLKIIDFLYKISFEDMKFSENEALKKIF